ncbi:hypothetical protein JAAARDRAFT_28551 [Jaapia argillacea MUCL 33604]|uniref:HTH APSES-type domain-containing protein n=1 Tax=Jaapia argillacea MUCL 33604 TaxID=933084 RepID=A0A067QMY1_9AGAM|nr:hypothetical protein JAAARDRAFT_28551 [Jaapia argillacea MUCL 33604]
MPDNQIFKATYSGIPVYEMMSKGVAVMRRRSDSWLNATQILKVAGFDKPQRTRILEREVQKGEHEKVQGGYGKYQGTWIPLERSIELCKQYNCEHLLRPILEFQAAAKSPPLAPKHLVAAPGSRPNPRRTGVEAPGVSTRSARKAVPEAEEESELDTLSVRGSEDGTLTPSPSEVSSSSRTPSPIRSSPDPSRALSDGPEDYHTQQQQPSTRNGRARKRKRSVERQVAVDEDGMQEHVNDPQQYADQILEYFISDTNQIPQCLISPPIDFDPNIAIDDDGHTALHWAAAMGRLRIVKLLLTSGADIFKVNRAGQTALMRSVMFANNYDVRKFPELYELLHRSTLNIDNANRTVFHHIVDVAMSKGKTHAARYYMETILNRLSDYPRELADIINFQDEDGETALTLAARCRSKRLVKLLIDHNADPKLVNNDGKSTEDYILEDERFRSSPVMPSRTLSMSFRNAQAAFPPPGSQPGYSFGPANDNKPPLHFSMAAQKASTRCVNDMTSMLDSLAASFDQELRDKERDMTQAHGLLGNIQTEILESQRAVTQLKNQSQGLSQAKSNLKAMEEELTVKMGNRYRLGWEKWVKDEEEREKSVREVGGGQLIIPSMNFAFHPNEDHMEGVETGVNEGSRTKGKRKALPLPEDISDLVALHSNIPTDEEGLHQACEALRNEIVQHRKRRKTLFDEFARHQEEAGTGGRMAEYRRLIGAGCGGIPPHEVDNVLGMLLESLEGEEPSSSSTAWSGAMSRPLG